ncbi:unnamed protein product [Dovyalis caffra]|uniref:Uncharacterized protein n=1 Tax=Dovyalis caffra TaxID=77055 RepID=A0AAV1S0B8_9ROSI|nr:unnamed protein product [Dovyalis caffra]
MKAYIWTIDVPMLSKRIYSDTGASASTISILLACFYHHKRKMSDQSITKGIYSSERARAALSAIRSGYSKRGPFSIKMVTSSTLAIS